MTVITSRGEIVSPLMPENRKFFAQLAAWLSALESYSDNTSSHPPIEDDEYDL